MPAGLAWFSLVNATRTCLVQLGQCQQDLPGSAWSMPPGPAWFSLVNANRTCLVQLGQCQQDQPGSAWSMPTGPAWFSLVNANRTCLVQPGQCQQTCLDHQPMSWTKIVLGWFCVVVIGSSRRTQDKFSEMC